MKHTFENNNVILTEAECFNVALSLDCGQAFRWREESDGSWSGVVKGKELVIKQEQERIILFNTNPEDYESLKDIVEGICYKNAKEYFKF